MADRHSRSKYLALLFCHLTLCVSCSGTSHRETAERVQPTVPVEFRLAFDAASSCSGCQLYSFTDSIGMARLLYADPTSDTVLRSEDVRDILAWIGPGGAGNLTLVVEDSGLGRLDDLAAQAEALGSFVLVSVGGIVLGDFDHRLLRALNGVLPFTFFVEEDHAAFVAALSLLGLSRDSLRIVSEKDLLAGCHLVVDLGVGTSAECETSSWAEIERQRKWLLQEAEKDVSAVERRSIQEPSVTH